MKPMVRSVLAGVAGAAGAYGVDTYVIGANQPTPNVYYAAGAGAALGAYLMRKKPIALGVLGGLAVGAVFLGYQHQAASSALSAAPRAVVPPVQPTPYPYGYPPSPYGYPPPAPAPAQPLPQGSSGPSLQDIQKLAQQGQQWGQQLAETFGGGTPQAVPWEEPAVSDSDFYGV